MGTEAEMQAGFKEQLY